jgi:hypothetical protein
MRPPDGKTILNQMQLVGTLLTFSVVVIDGLRALGLDVDKDEAENWIELWKFVGKELGIQGENIPKDYADSCEALQAIRDNFWHSSPEGAALTAKTLDVISELLPGVEFDGIGTSLLRHLAGDRCAELLDVPPSDWTRKVVTPSPIVAMVLGRLTGGYAPTPLSPLLSQAAFVLMRTLADHEREGKGAPVRIPAQFRSRWESDFALKYRL